MIDGTCQCEDEREREDQTPKQYLQTEQAEALKQVSDAMYGGLTRQLRQIHQYGVIRQIDAPPQMIAYMELKEYFNVH